ncbi:hypothetical protein BX281_9442 [Streptomyces sp. Ag82_O1-15]|nr:hypothetical protein BX281_9442 [Streptomyces sp. Ag82_O1-15]
MLLGGRVADVFGAHRTVLVGIAVFTTSSLVSGLAAGAPMPLGGALTVAARGGRPVRGVRRGRTGRWRPADGPPHADPPSRGRGRVPVADRHRAAGRVLLPGLGLRRRGSPRASSTPSTRWGATGVAVLSTVAAAGVERGAIDGFTDAFTFSAIAAAVRAGVALFLVRLDSCSRQPGRWCCFHDRGGGFRDRRGSHKASIGRPDDGCRGGRRTGRCRAPRAGCGPVRPLAVDRLGGGPRPSSCPGEDHRPHRPGLLRRPPPQGIQGGCWSGCGGTGRARPRRR